MSDSFVNPWTIACQAPLSMGFPRQEFCSGLPFLSAEHLPDPGIKPMSTTLTGGFFSTEPTGNSCFSYGSYLKIVKFFIVELYLGFSHQWLPLVLSVVKVKVLVPQSCPTLWDSTDYSLPGSSVLGILQARMRSGWSFPSPKVKVSQLCPTLRPHGLYSLWNSPGQNTGVGSHSLLQGIFPTQ